MKSHYHPKCYPRPKKVITITSTDEDIVAWLETAESGYEERSEIEKAALVADIRWGMENDPKERAKMQGSAKKRKWEEILDKIKQERGPDVMEIVDSEEEDTSMKKKKKHREHNHGCSSVYTHTRSNQLHVNILLTPRHLCAISFRAKECLVV
jgi:uncharacterized protein YwqG